MEPDVNQHEKDREHRPLDVLLHDLVEAESMQHHRVGVSVNGREEFLVAKLDSIADFDLEVSHKFDLLVVPVAELVVALVDRLAILEELTVAVLERTSEEEQRTDVVHLYVVLADIFIEHDLEIGPDLRVLHSTLQSVIKLVLGNILKIIRCQIKEVKHVERTHK